MQKEPMTCKTWRRLKGLLLAVSGDKQLHEMHFRFVAQSSRSTSVIFNNPKVCNWPNSAIQVAKILVR
jgi:hypothetical protein